MGAAIVSNSAEWRHEDMAAAARALADGDMARAQTLWRNVRQAANAPLDAWLLAAAHLEPDAAMSLLREASEHFPTVSRVIHDLARAAERALDWHNAEQAWRAYIVLEPGQYWGHGGLISALMRQQRLEEANTVLAGAIQRFPAEAELPALYARIAEAEKDWPEAIRRWQQVIALFPERWAGYRGKASALAASGREAESDAFLDASLPQFTADVHALHDRARLAEKRRDWSTAEAAWRGFIQMEARFGWAHIGLAQALRAQGHLKDAGIVLADAEQLLPHDAGIAIEAAQVCEVQGDFDGAIRQWRRLARLRPASPEGALGEVTILRAEGRWEMADETIQSALKQLPESTVLYEAYVQNAMAQNKWAEASARCQAAQARFPNTNVFRQRMFELELRLADTGTPSVTNAEGGASEDRGAIRTLLMEFESLGGGGHGCEFGIFQRFHGAEPLGLLRWADVYQDKLSEALETDFAGVGEPDYTNIFVPNSSGRQEYWTTDKRYHMAMRCFVYADEVSLDRMTRQVSRRLIYLRTKLMDDLRTASKIFVYKNMKRNLTETELERLYNGVRRYGDTTLLYIRYQDEKHPNGTVHIDRPWLLIGYIDHFSHTPDTDTFIGNANESLLRICQAAHRLWKCETKL